MNLVVDNSGKKKEIVRANGLVGTSTPRRIDPEYLPVFHENVDSSPSAWQNARCT